MSSVLDYLFFDWWSSEEQKQDETNTEYPDTVTASRDRVAVRIHFEHSDPAIYEYHYIDGDGAMISLELIDSVTGYDPDVEEWDMSYRIDGVVNVNSVEHIEPVARYTDTFEVPVVRGESTNAE